MILKKYFKIEYLGILLLFIVALAMRSYRLTSLFPFTMDEEYQAFLVKNIISGQHLPLIGVNVANTGLYLGPFFTYLSVIPYYLANLNPLGTAWVAAILGSLVTILIVIIIYQQTKKLPLALLAGLFYAINPLVNLYDRKFWNPSLVILLTLLWFWALLNISKNRKWWLLIALVLGLSFHVHYSLLVLALPTSWQVWQQGFFKQKMKWSKLKSWSLIIFLLCLLPLFLFEIRHNFLQTQSLITLISPFGKEGLVLDQSIWDKFKIIWTILGNLWFLGWKIDITKFLTFFNPSIIKIILGLLWLPLLIFLLKKSKYHQITKLIGAILASLVLILLFYSGPIAPYYLLLIFPLFLILLALFFDNLIFSKQKFAKNLNIGFLTILLIVWTSQSLSLTNHLGWDNKIKIFELTRKYLKDRPYNLEVLGDYSRYEGYRYITEFLGLKPVSSYMDNYFAWLYPQDVGQPAVYDLVIYNQQDLDKKAKQQWRNWQITYSDWRLQTSEGDFGIIVLKRKD